jgi:hypothetical protein
LALLVLAAAMLELPDEFALVLATVGYGVTTFVLALATVFVFGAVVVQPVKKIVTTNKVKKVIVLNIVLSPQKYFLDFIFVGAKCAPHSGTGEIPPVPPCQTKFDSIFQMNLARIKAFSLCF